MTTAPKLKPCPFCGGAFEIVKFSKTEWGLKHATFMPGCPAGGITYWGKYWDAVRACNRRTP